MVTINHLLYLLLYNIFGGVQLLGANVLDLRSRDPGLEPNQWHPVSKAINPY